MLRWLAASSSLSSSGRCVRATTLPAYTATRHRQSTTGVPGTQEPDVTRQRRRKPSQRKKSSSTRRSPQRSQFATSSSGSSRAARPNDQFATKPTAGTRLPRSLDIAEEMSRVDVERHFPEAISFLRQPSRSVYAADEKRKRHWHNVTHDVNVDGAPVAHPRGDDAGTASCSFFDEGSLDIRGGLRDRAQRAGMALPTRDESLSPDILHLTGGSANLHGLALADKSNAAPADETIEGDPSENNFGDTPVELTDMLRERLMELKAERISEERNETFLPRRLPHLATDAQLQQSHLLSPKGRLTAPRSRSSTTTALLTYAEAAQEGERASEAARTDSSSRERTLADLRGPSSSDAQALTEPTRLSAVARDGYDVSAALPVARSAAAYTPGGLYGADLDALLSLNGATSQGRLPGPTDSARESEGCVYLLRVLPRAGFCSRREAIAIVASGQVTVGGVVERNPFRLVRADEDVLVAGHHGRLRVAPPRLWMYHKPANVVVSRSDPAGRRLITRHANILGFDHLIPVGSLPTRSHGILLFTNDGELSRYLENPQTMIQQTYLLRVRPAIDPSLAQKLNETGVNINGRQYHQAEFLVNPAMKSRFSVKVKVRGETMPIAHLMQHLGRVVERGGRISFGPFSLGTLAVGSVREVTVPPHYMEHAGNFWKPFVERDWPYFRRQRVSRLRRLCRYRELTPKELEELDNFTYEEVQDALSFEERELTAAADARAALSSPTGSAPLDSDVALPADVPFSRNLATEEGAPFGAYTAHGEDDVIVQDITRVH